jgi:polyphosphate kinase
MEIVDHGFFRVTRDADFDISDEADDLLRAVEAELRRRRFGEVVRLEVDTKMSPPLRDELIEALEVEERQVYVIDGLLDLTDLWQIVKLPGFSDLRDTPWTPVTQPRLQGEDDGHVDIFSVIRAGRRASCTIPTTRSPRRSSASSSRRPTTPRSWPSR